ncbi:uncharacterized protein LOC119725502 [Patiria miniata]|uniref:ZAD domain-containing protein n=1 Tax=Patiria miniata TaxID=46514 RepID=A0A913ZP66_PATMI|nr:uncharacterized protein LOC119725502 [Patiria miniata]
MKMPQHRQCLQGICRLCGVERSIEKGRRPIQKEKLSANIVAALGISVAGDIQDVHPPFVCKVCEGKLKRWWVQVKHKKMKASCYITPVTFERSSCDTCCMFTGDAQEELSMADVEVAAKDVGLVTWQGPGCLQIMKMSTSTCRPAVYLTIFPNSRWDLVISGVCIAREDHAWLEFGESLSQEDVRRMLKDISSKYVCVGNQDFPALVEAEKGGNGQIPVNITLQDSYVEGTIRHRKCRFLIQEEGRCTVCRVHRSDLMAKTSKIKSKSNQAISASSSMPNKHMTKKQLKDKVTLLQTQRRTLKRRVNVLQDKVSDMLHKECVDLSREQDEALREAVVTSNDEMEGILRPNSYSSM